MFGLLNSASARSAAFFIDWAASPALPLADSGRMIAILTWPVPSAVPVDAGAAAGGGGGGELLVKRSVLIEQAARNPAKPAASRPRTGCAPGYRLNPPSSNP